ncbi:cytochrome c oxidase assembly protein [Planococcus sp. 1R117A]|uniref:cytochrome c oxidase assembly protein n=1 Tax=Planococcus sp. 1R117A TaxID=3447020 RepID=UPI003EDB85AB
MEHGLHSEVTAAEFGTALLMLTAIVIYVNASVMSGKRYRKWPLYRIFLWILGVLAIGAVCIGPLASRAHSDFTVHMLNHLLIGMLAPLLMVLSSPVALLLRSLSVVSARKVARILKSRLVCFMGHPITAAFLNTGGLFVLYTTDLFFLMHEHLLLYVLVHFHFFAAGYLFTASIIYIDPVAHRVTFLYRSAVLVLALAGHGILAKLIYADPPETVLKSQAEAGSMLMYYGGDAIDAVLIIVFCYQWFISARQRQTVPEGGFK